MNKIVIRGSFWDSYIYSNSLILYKFDGTLESFDWEKLICSRISKSERDFLAYQCSFLNGDYLYGVAAKDLFYDIDIKSIIRSKFRRIKDISFDCNDLQKFTTCKSKIEMDELPIDMGVYNNTLYYCKSSGVFKRNLRRNNDSQYISTKEHKIWDGKVQCLKVGRRGRIALSTSSDGLFELNSMYNPYNLNEDYRSLVHRERIIPVSTEHSSYCSWSFSSMFSGSYEGIFFLNGLKYVKDPEARFAYDIDSDYMLKFCGTYREKDIFHNQINNALIVSGNEKIYRITNNQIEIVKFTQKNLASEDEIFNYLNSLQHGIIEKILVAEVTDFGIIIETSRRLYVLQSNGELILINPTEEVVKWRVYPRSIQYTNQLHVIYNDRMEILSFNDDYFENQEKKLFGYRHTDL